MPTPRDGVVVPTVPGRLKQEEFEFVKDFKGREGSRHSRDMPCLGTART